MTMPVQDAVTTSVRMFQAVRGDTRKALAEVLGVTPAAVSHRLGGLTKWSLDDLDALARHWGVSPAQLLEPPVEAFAGRPVTPSPIGTGRKRQRSVQRIGGSILTLPLPRTAFEQVAA